MLEIQNLTFDVDSDGSNKEIIRDISLTVPDGQLTVCVSSQYEPLTIW